VVPLLKVAVLFKREVLLGLLVLAVFFGLQELAVLTDLSGTLRGGGALGATKAVVLIEPAVRKELAVLIGLEGFPELRELAPRTEVAGQAVLCELEAPLRDGRPRTRPKPAGTQGVGIEEGE